MHLANTPVVSPESKNPALAGFSLYSNCSLFVAAIVAQLMPSMNGLSNFLGSFQYQTQKTAQKSKNIIPRFPKVLSLTGTPLL